MSDKEDYLTSYRVFFETFAATVNPEDQLPVNIAGYTITEAELPGEVLYWTTQYLTEKSCPLTLMTPLRRIILDEVRIASKKQPNEFGYKTDEGVYIALRLMQAVTARVNAVCLRYLDNSRLDSLPPPPPPAQRELTTVSCATKNSRRVMEDRHVEIGNLEALFGIETTEPTSFYAVYDGHAGSAAATYCAAHLHQYVVESPHFASDLQRAMRDAFLRTDTEFVRKSNQERACGGSTAVAVAVRSRRLVAAWAGDSLALLAKRMRLMQLVRPHKPGRQDERARIESSGGTVMYWGTWRVNGQLAVSRAIGDAQYKPYVTARPEIATVELDGDEDFVVVACDGLWDFVSEDDVALAVYRQLAEDPDDLKAVTKRLVVQAKRQGSADNISIIVVFLKDPRHIAADNRPPMDLGLDNALANAPPFVMETEACKRLDAVAAETEAESAECGDGDADNGVDHSDSDSEDLGPETAVDVDADDLDSDARNHAPAPPTPPAHTVEASHIDGALVDNVAESGEESEDEWNYFKGEGAARRDEADDPPRSETPCQDNSAWESSSADMNSSPLNPDAPVFVPGVGGTDVLLAESPRKPLPMDDIELPDSAQFRTEAVVRPAELLDLDNCDQLNGHHNISIEGVKEQLNGNEKSTLDSLGFGFDVGSEPDRAADTALIQDLQRIQKDTTDFCDIQVFHQSHTETNPFAADGNEELFERLKNKERDPMSMSFYQEKDDDTCERAAQPMVDLNAVQPLPDSDEEDTTHNGVCDSSEKENISPQHADLLGLAPTETEPDNDAIRFDERTDVLNNAPNFGHGDGFMDFSVSSNNMQNYSNMDFESNNAPQDVAQTETPESHKLLFEQIPEIPDGKSSDLGFTNEDTQDPSESEKDVRVSTPQEETSQDVEMESKLEDSPCEDISELTPELKEDEIEPVHFSAPEQVASPETVQLIDDMNEIISESALTADIAPSTEQLAVSPAPGEEHKPATAHDVQENTVADVHQGFEPHLDDSGTERTSNMSDFNGQFGGEAPEKELDASELKFESEDVAPVAASPAPAASPLPPHSPPMSAATTPASSPAPAHSPAPPHSPPPPESPLSAESPAPAEVPLPLEASVPEERHMTPYEYISSKLPLCCVRPDLPPTFPRFVNSESVPRRQPAPVPLQVPAYAQLHAWPPQLQPQPGPRVPRSARSEHRAAQPEPRAEQSPELSGPAPDIVPEELTRSDLVTDIDIGIPESRAQEICVPVTSEIHHDDAVVPAPADPAAPLAGDLAPPADSQADTAALAGAVTAATAAVAAVATAAAVTKSKTTPATKKTPTALKADTRTTKLAPKTGTPARTPTSAKKPASSTTTTPAAKTPVPRTTPARTPASAAKPAATPTSATRPASRTTPAKASAPPARPATKLAPAPAPARTTTAPLKSAPAAAKTATATRAAPPAVKPAPVKEAAAVAKSAAPARAAPAARPAPRPAPAAARPATAPARPAAAAAARPRTSEKKPLTNGDVKTPADKPAPRPPPITRPAPRPTPRAPPPAAASATAPPKPAGAPRPAPRAPRPPPSADKNTHLATRRIGAKTAPPRTAPTKAPAGTKKPVPVPKKVVIEVKKEEANGPASALTNGAAEPDAELAAPCKPPPSPPAADNALLPDVIA